MDQELDDRKKKILKAIIKTYMETGEPVGSRTISKFADLNVSSATIRNEMSDLTDMGYIVQPHTSAGRIPSDKGYRLYVDELMKEKESEVQEIKDDYRLRLLNADPGDTLNSDEFWRALIEDYYLGKGGYVYINREGLEIKSLHYVKEEDVSIVINSDPIFKDYDIMVNGRTYLPHEFFKIHRRARDGASSLPIWQENPLIFGVAYNSLVFEENLVKKGGNKKGFIESENRLDKDSIGAIRNAWRKVYSNDTENVVVLNKGAKFKESSNTSVEMQLNENKETNGDEICKIFGFPSSILTGGATNNATRPMALRWHTISCRSTK